MAKARQYTEQLTDNQAEQCAVNLTGLKHVRKRIKSGKAGLRRRNQKRENGNVRMLQKLVRIGNSSVPITQKSVSLNSKQSWLV